MSARSWIVFVVAVLLVNVGAAATLLSYEQSNWNPLMKSLLSQSPRWIEAGWKDRFVVEAPPGLEETLREVQELIVVKPQRARNAANIAMEDAFVGNRYYKYLRVESYTHPRTVRLITAIVDEAAIVVMYFKNRFNRARPWEYSAEIDPIIPPPGHPAYPSGHSTQAHSISMVLATVMPEISSELESLAYEIARNREIGGVHYQSDSAAGRQLAEQIVAELLQSEAFLQEVELIRREFTET